MSVYVDYIVKTIINKILDEKQEHLLIRIGKMKNVNYSTI